MKTALIDLFLIHKMMREEEQITDRDSDMLDKIKLHQPYGTITSKCVKIGVLVGTAS